MCGRFTLTSDKKDLMNYLELERWDSDFTWQPSYNIAPTQKTPVLTGKKERKIRGMYWGLVPHWSKDMKVGSRMINARVETLTKKPAYANLLRSQRCIVLSNGYYEWMQTSRGKQPYYIHDPENIILPFAGLWDKWQNDKMQYRITCTIITIDTSKELKHIHNRMPLILTKDRMEKWIDCNQPKDHALQSLKPYNKPLDYYPVSKFVNTPFNNSQQCMEPMIAAE